MIRFVFDLRAVSFLFLISFTATGFVRPLQAQAPPPPTDSPSALYEKAIGSLSGARINQNGIASRDLLQRSADLGYLPAQIALGFIYETGFGVQVEPDIAAIWYKKAAQKNDPLANWLLGKLYVQHVIAGGYPDAARWLQPAADAGDPFGAYLLAIALQETDRARAGKYFRQAANGGLPYAQYRLGLALRDGRGVPRNTREAYIWLLLSSDAGVSEAESPLAELEGSLGTAVVAEAKTEAERLRPSVIRSANAGKCTGWEGELAQIPASPPLKIQPFCH